MNKSTRVLLVSLLSVAVLAGCSKKVKEEPAAPVDTGTSTTTPTGPSTSGLYGPGDLDTDACLRQRVVYFDLDKEDVKPEFQAIMRATPSTCVTVRPRASPCRVTPTSAVRARTTRPWVSVVATASTRPCRPTVARLRS